MIIRSPLRHDLDKLEARWGSDDFWREIERKKRARIQISDRAPRTKVSLARRIRMWDEQKGLCGHCKEPMESVRKAEIGHIDTGRTDFNHPSNLQLEDRRCNREKGAKSIHQLSKRYSRTYTSFIK